MVAKKKSNPKHLSYLMSGTGMIVYWWGVWGILEHFLLPNHQLLSYIIGISCGLSLLYLNDRTFKELG
ncbi:hypothetical protein BH11PAT4_BH11PAT4_1220 [soil metagenome]